MQDETIPQYMDLLPEVHMRFNPPFQQLVGHEDNANNQDGLFQNQAGLLRIFLLTMVLS